MELVTRPHAATAHQQGAIERTLAQVRYAVLARLGGQHTGEVNARVAQLRDELYESRGLILPGPRAPTAQLSPEVSTAFFQELRGVVESSIWQFGYMDVVPVYFFDMDEWARGKLGAIGSVLRNDPRGADLRAWLRSTRRWLPELPSPNKGVIGTVADMLTGADPSAYSRALDDAADRIISTRGFTRHGGPTPEIHYGPAVSAGKLRVEFDWSPCVRKTRGETRLHTWDVFDFLFARGRWSDLEEIYCAAPAHLREVINRVRYHYFIILQPLAARVMTRVVGSIRGEITLVIADYRIEHISPIFVTLGKYLETWDVHLDLTARADIRAHSCAYCEDTFGIPRDEIISAVAIYFETAHKIYRANIPPGKTLAGGPYLPSNCITLPDLSLYHQVRALYNKYDANYGAKCQRGTFSQEEQERVIARYIDDIIAKAPRTSERPKYTLVVAAPGTGKSTYLKTYVKNALMLVRDDIIENIRAGYTLHDTTEETRARLEDDLRAINSPLARFIKGTLSPRCRLCKDNFWNMAELIMERTIKKIHDEQLPINICVETIGTNDDIIIANKYARGFDCNVAFLRISIDKEHRQQLGRLLIERRVNDWYAILKYAKMALDGFNKYRAMGLPHDIFIVSDNPPLLQIVAAGKKISSATIGEYLDRDFDKFLREFT